VVVVEIIGVVNEVTPVPPDNGEPPVGTEYQSMVDPEGAVAVSVNVPVPHLEKLLSDVGAMGRAFTVITVAALVAEHELAFVTTTV
jgi:hypothetical protein